MRITEREARAFLADDKRRPKMWPDELRPAESSLLKQAQVSAVLLTGDPAWDVFQQRIQALIDSERTSLNGMADTMLPNMTSEQVLMAHRHMIAAKARIDAWEQCLRLPNEILRAATTSQAAE